MSKLSLCEIQQSQLDKTPIVDGQLVCCLDTGSTYRDTDSGRVQISSDLEIVSELPLAPLDGKLYYLKPNDLYINLSGTWILLNDRDFLLSANKGASNGSAAITLKAASTSSVPIIGKGATTVTTNSNGEVVIASTDNDTWRGIQNNLTSSSETDSLAAAQGKILKALVDEKSDIGHTHTWDSVTDKPDTFTPSSHTHGVIKNLSVNGTTLSWTKDDGTTGSLTTQDTDTTYEVFEGATETLAGNTGLVTMPRAGDQDKFLCGDGSWAVPVDTWRGIQDNLTSTSTVDSLSANQGKVLKGLIDSKADSTHIHKKSDITDFPTLGTAAAKNVKSLSDVGNGGWKDTATDEQYVPDMNFMKNWNGAYSGTSSNLIYCSKGAFGTMATKDAAEYALTDHTHKYAGSSSIGGAATSANKVNSSLTILLNGTSQGAWDGSSAKSINVTAASVGATSVTISRW